MLVWVPLALLTLPILVLLLVGELVVNSIIKVLIVELLICAVKFTHSDAKPQHDVFFLHHRRAVLRESSLLSWISLARVERAEDDTACRTILEQACAAFCAD